MTSMAPDRLRVLVVLTALAVAPSPARAQSNDPVATLDRVVAAAEGALREGELQIAESRYRDALMAAWMIVGSVRAADGRLVEAREAFGRAATATIDARAAQRALALVHLRLNEPAPAIDLLAQLTFRDPKDFDARRLLAQAFIAAGRPAEAVQELEEARDAAPNDPEVAFFLASTYLRVDRIDDAERLFAEVIKARPIAATDVLIGRTYRDLGQYARARAALRHALEMDPNVRRAHYYLGTIALLEEGVLRLDEAIAEFKRELTLAPTDSATNFRLGMALVEAKRYEEALPALEQAARAPGSSADTFYYLGRCLVALDRSQEALAALQRALELLTGASRRDEARVGATHYQLAVALRQTGAAREAAAHFEEAQRASARRTAGARQQLAAYLSDEVDSPSSGPAVPLDALPLAALAPGVARTLEQHAVAALARTYLNLGIMHAQAERFVRAAQEFERAAAIDPQFPQVQYSLGVAYFNAQQHAKAAEALERALAAAPADANVRRMLALAWFSAATYDKAAALLANDPQRDADPALQYAYGLSLVRSGRAAEAETIFSRLLTTHGNTAELQVVIGQAHAQQGDFESAIASLQRARQLKSDVAEANAALGHIYLKQGRLAEAAAALRAELQAHPADLNARHTLATVLDLTGENDEAVAELRKVLAARPDHADARYLLGKVLLARGAALEAIEQLEAAARLRPEDANIYYQLGQAYQKLGRIHLAERQFERFRQLKDKRRGRQL